MNNYLSTLGKATRYCVVFLVPLASFGSVIAGNLGGAPPGYNDTLGNTVGDDFLGVGDNLGEGVSFVPTSGGTVSTVKVALSCFESGLCPDNFTVALDRNNGGLPGTAIETYTVSGSSLGNTGSPNPVVVLTSTTNPVLAAGTEYWLTITTDTNNSGVWNFNQTGDASPTAVSLDGGMTWASAANIFPTPGGYEIDSAGTTVTPEPASIALVLGSALLIGLGRKLRDRSS